MCMSVGFVVAPGNENANDDPCCTQQNRLHRRYVEAGIRCYDDAFGGMFATSGTSRPDVVVVGSHRMHQTHGPQLAAVLDMGASAIRLVIAEIDSGGSIRI